ncbi:MAG: VapE domain-containing protein [Pseudoruegeria sp.]
MTAWKEAARHTGWIVFPIRIEWNGTKWDKKPLVKAWHNVTKDQIDTMSWENANGFGILTGGCGGPYVLDLDTYKEGSEADAWLASRGLNGPTRTHKTVSGGIHKIYTLPPTVNLRNRANIVHGLDSRGDGGFIAFGEGYEVIDDSIPAQLSATHCAELDTGAKAARDETDHAAFQSAPLTPHLIERVGWLKIEQALGVMSDRSKALFTVAAVTKGAGFTPSEYAATVIGLSVSAKEHVESQKRPLRALARAWDDAGPSFADSVAAMPAVTARVPLPKPVRRKATEGQIIYNEKEVPQWCLSTALAYIEGHDDWENVLAHNEFSGEFIVTRPIPSTDATRFVPHELTDQDFADAETWFNRNGFPRASEAIVVKAVKKAARQNTINPIKQYLSDLRWDGTKRLDMWLTRHMGAGDSIYTREIGKRTLIGAVARVMRPGVKVDTMLILEGVQGINKSQALRVLAGEEYFTDSMPDLKNKDAADQIKGIWIVEMAELDMVNRASMETTKAFLSRQEDRYRPSFGKTRITQKRQCIFIGTTNQDNYLRDETGSRRFWPIKVTAIDLEGLRRDRDQLWAEAVALFQSSERWWLDRNVEIIATSEQRKRNEDDPWIGAVLNYVSHRTEITIREILQHGLGVELSKAERKDSNRVAGILKGNGWERNGLVPSGNMKGQARYSKVRQ